MQIRITKDRVDKDLGNIVSQDCEGFMLNNGDKVFFAESMEKLLIIGRDNTISIIDNDYASCAQLRDLVDDYCAEYTIKSVFHNVVFDISYDEEE